MKLVCLLLAFGLGAGDSAALEKPPTEILPGRPTNSLAFDIRSERLPEGDTRFTVKITLQHSLSDYITSLGIVRITHRPNGETMEHRVIRDLTSEQNEGVIKCVFSVTQKELDDPDLCFRFFPVSIGERRGPGCFARLSNHLPP